MHRQQNRITALVLFLDQKFTSFNCSLACSRRWADDYPDSWEPEDRLPQQLVAAWRSSRGSDCSAACTACLAAAAGLHPRQATPPAGNEGMRAAPTVQRRGTALRRVLVRGKAVRWACEELRVRSGPPSCMAPWNV